MIHLPCVTRRQLVLLVSALLSSNIASPACADPKNLPNIVFVLADDLGIGDVKCFGGDRCQIETPAFDQLAE